MQGKPSVAVDRLGDIQKQISVLEESAERIKDSLKALGDGIYIGEHYEAAVYSQERTYTDWLKVVLKLKIPAKTIAKFSTKKSVICLQIREKTPS